MSTANKDSQETTENSVKNSSLHLAYFWGVCLNMFVRATVRDLTSHLQFSRSVSQAIRLYISLKYQNTTLISPMSLAGSVASASSSHVATSGVAFAQVRLPVSYVTNFKMYLLGHCGNSWATA